MPSRKIKCPKCGRCGKPIEQELRHRKERLCFDCISQKIYTGFMTEMENGYARLEKLMGRGKMDKKTRTKLDKLWSEAIKKRANYRCERNPAHAHNPRSLNSHHIFSRRNTGIRWNLHNGICLCVGCHRYAHREPLAFHEWLKQYKGERDYEHLLFIKSEYCKPDPYIIEAYLKQCV